MNIIYSDQAINIRTGQSAIFLAGPTPRGSSVASWRPHACQILQDLGFNGEVLVPENSNNQPRLDYIDQAEWEYQALHQATVIIFWIPRKLPNMLGLTTNVEFGFWVKSGKVLYGRPDVAEKIKYLDWLYQKETGLQPENNLVSLLKAALLKTAL